MSENKTIYQKLGGLFGSSGIKIQDKEISRYNIADTELLRTTDKAEFELGKKQMLQNKYLQNQWQRVEHEIFQKSVHQESTRIGSYSDFEAMEFYPEIAAALDIFSEECCLHGDTKIKLLNGNIFTIKELYDGDRKDFWVYAVDTEDNIIKPSIVDSVIFKGIKDVYKITLDNGYEIMCTDDHKWLTYSNDWIETKDIVSGILLSDMREKCGRTPVITLDERDDKTIGGISVLSVEYVGKSEVYDLLNSSVSSNFGVVCGDNSMLISHNCTVNDKGKILNIYSDSERVRGILEDLFFNRLDIHTTLHMWVRNVCKLGDNFLYLNMNDKQGIIGAKQLPIYEIERREIDLASSIINKDKSDETVKFVWRGRNIEFNSWQIAHFRLLNDDRKLPYGTSLLEKCRRIWKGLVLMEDAMMVYRITRAPERRVFKVNVGNIDEEDVPAYINQMANKFKRTPVIDSKTGQIDTKYNQYAADQDYIIPVRGDNVQSPIETLPGACISLNTRIPLLDGRTLMLSEIIDEWNDGNRNLWVYSCDPYTGKLAPGMITWAGETRKNAEVIKITLDNGEEVISTPDHKFVHRTNGFVEAKDLVVGDSLMPYYTLETDWSDNVETLVWDSNDNLWVSNKTFDISNGNKGFVNDIKILEIEYLESKEDTGTITVDGDEVYHNYHTFAIESGIFIKNSNLDSIGDISYLQAKLFTALRVPKSFLGFDDAMGDGKNLALQDIRFTRTVNRIQQAIIMELNKIAIIHLYLLGFEDELDNFSITMNNPSTQAEMLKIEHWQQRITVYQEAVRDAGNGFGAMSMTRAKRDFLGMSNDEIKQDLLEQRMEKAAAAELEQTSTVIKKTGFFDIVDNIYGIPEDERESENTDGADGGESDAKGGFGGGGGFGGDDMDLGDDTENADDAEQSDTADTEDTGFDDAGADSFGGDEADFGKKEESFIRKTNNILTEKKDILNKRLSDRTKRFESIYTNRLIESVSPENINRITSKFSNNSMSVNNDIDFMIKSIDKLVGDE